MQSFIKFICPTNVPCDNEWLIDPDTAFKAAGTNAKVSFILGQAVALNYLERVFNSALPSLINEYKEKVVRDWMPELEYAVESESDDPEKTKAAYVQAEYLLMQTGEISAEEIEAWMKPIEGAPVTLQNTFYSPYLRFLERAHRAANYGGEYAESTESFSIPGPVSLPTFALRGDCLCVNEDITFPSYKYDYKSNHEYGNSQYGLGVASIFSYWRGYDWKNVNFNGVVGVLASQCLELDTNTYPDNSLLWVYNDIYRAVTSWEPYFKEESNLQWLSSESNFLRQCVLHFLMDLRDRYNIKFDDADLLAKIIGKDNEDANKLHAFLTAEKPSEVSVEMYDAFQKSDFARYSELDLIKYKRLSSRELMEAAIDAKGSRLSNKSFDELDEEDSSDTPQDDPASDTPADEPKANRRRLSDKSFDDLDAESEEEGAAQPDDGDDTAETENQPDETEESSDNDPNGTDGTEEGQDADTFPDDEPNATEDDPNGSDDNQSHTHNTQHNEVTRTDDKKGVKLELSAGETTDSVLYKIELEAYIDSLIANPPDFLSVQKVELLKRMKAYWLNFLNVDCLVGFLKSVIKLPKYLNLKQNKVK